MPKNKKFDFLKLKTKKSINSNFCKFLSTIRILEIFSKNQIFVIFQTEDQLETTLNIVERKTRECEDLQDELKTLREENDSVSTNFRLNEKFLKTKI